MLSSLTSAMFLTAADAIAQAAPGSPSDQTKMAAAANHANLRMFCII